MRCDRGAPSGEEAQPVLSPRLVDTADVPAVGQAGGVLLTDTVATAGLDMALAAALSPWCRPLAVHDPGKVVLDLAVSLALGTA